MPELPEVETVRQGLAKWVTGRRIEAVEVRHPRAIRRHAPDENHLRVRFVFADDGPELRFVDQRTFGGLAVSEGGAELPAEIAHIARDPMDPEFSDAGFVAAIRAKRTEVKRALLDQTLISGVGNIYADEALWRAQLHGLRPTSGLTKPAALR